MIDITSGRLITSPLAPYSGRVFLHIGGRRHWVPSATHLQAYGLRLESTVEVAPAALAAIPKAGSLPMPFGADDVPRSDADPLVIREFACSVLRGEGMEFGAGTNPMPIPVGCRVNYADFISDEQLHDVAYEAQGQDFVRLDQVCDLQTMEGVADATLDFVVACHVIEHVPNPLGAMRTAFQKLKAGGSLVLVVPDMTRTFDHTREATPLAHLIEDFEHPNPCRDLIHFLEWFTKVMPVELGVLYRRVLDAHASRHDIHYHTWTYESFGELVRWAMANAAPFATVWSHPTSTLPQANEFYYVLRK